MTICMCDGGGSIAHEPGPRCTSGSYVDAQLLAPMFECVACGARYPIMPYYPAASPHGPNRDCRGEQGWKRVKEPYPPRLPAT